eukprot:8748250-Alexandrium_andersonii.AAC.1
MTSRWAACASPTCRYGTSRVPLSSPPGLGAEALSKARAKVARALGPPGLEAGPGLKAPLLRAFADVAQDPDLTPT